MKLAVILKNTISNTLLGGHTVKQMCTKKQQESVTDITVIEINIY